MRHEYGNLSEDVQVSVGGAMEDIMGYFDHAKLLMLSSSLLLLPQDGQTSQFIANQALSIER
jgi:hypothetical protein